MKPTQSEIFNQYKLDEKLRIKTLKLQPFIVILNIPSQRNLITVEYSSYSKGKVTRIDEIDGLEVVISSSTFNGKMCSGFCSSDIKDLKILLNQLKPSDFEDNEEICLDSYYK